MTGRALGDAAAEESLETIRSGLGMVGVEIERPPASARWAVRMGGGIPVATGDVVRPEDEDTGLVSVGMQRGIVRTTASRVLWVGGREAIDDAGEVTASWSSSSGGTVPGRARARQSSKAVGNEYVTGWKKQGHAY